MSSAADLPAASIRPRCAQHPEREAVGACQRCGTFVCDADRQLLDGILHCQRCAARREADPVEAFRVRHWGKPDLWAWAVGVSVLPQAWALYAAIRDHHGALWVAINSAFLVLDVAYFVGQRWARFAILATPLVALVRPPGTAELLSAPEGETFLIVSQAVVGALAALAVALMFFDVRNQLFFRVTVARERLERAYLRYADNRIAVWGLVLAVAGFMIPGLSVAALPMSITAWIRARSGVVPPIPRGGLAIIGVVVSVVSLAFWTAFVLTMLELAKRVDPNQLAL